MTEPAVVMVAPNGARRLPSDHKAVPIDSTALARTAADCQAAGAQAIHLHIRDAAGQHVLDADGYREASAAIRAATARDFAIQITTEAVGRYQPAEQMAVVRAVRPQAASVALRELLVDTNAEAAKFLAECAAMGTAIQHILYTPDEVTRLAALVRQGIVPQAQPGMLFVVGRYDPNGASGAEALLPFLAAREAAGLTGPWMVCAFGAAETAVLAAALALGGHARVGFENSLLHADGTVAADNADRVQVISRLRASLARPPARQTETLTVLGAP